MPTRAATAEKERPAKESPTRSRAHSHTSESSSSLFDFAVAQQSAGNLAVQRLYRSGVIQAKLSISQPNDPDEQEADQVAERVMRMPEPALGAHCSACSAGEEPCPECASQTPNQIRRKANGTGGQQQPSVASHVIGNLGAGYPLDKSTRAFFEPRLKGDFSDVRIHTDKQAAGLARTIRARAFTAGRDLIFGAGAYAPETEQGKRLLAHELAHVRKTSASESRVQRQDEPGAGTPSVPRAEAQPERPAPSGEPEAAREPALPPDLARRISYMSIVMQRITPLPEKDRARLEQIIPGSLILDLIRRRDAKREELKPVLGWIADYKARNEAIERGEQLAAGVGAGPEVMGNLQNQADQLTAEIEQFEALIQAELAKLGTDERGLLDLVWVRFPRIWEERAKDIVYAMLDENKTVAERERARYSELVCSPDTEGLLEADEHLGRETHYLETLQVQSEEIPRLIAEKQHQIEAGESQIEAVQRWGPLPAGVPPTAEEIQGLRDELERLTARAGTLNEQRIGQERVLSQLYMQYAAEFPILMSPEYRAGSLNRVPREQLGQITGEQIDEILENIEDTRENIEDNTVRVWDLHDVPALAFHELGVPADSVLGEAVQNYIANKKSNEFWLDIALAALGLVGGIVLTFATGGLALLGGVVAVSAGGASLYRSTSRYVAESAAERVALDPVIADISVNEPEILWVVLDVVGLGLDVGDIVRLLRPAARAVIATGDIAAFASEAERVAPELADRLVRSARGQLLARTGREAASDADLVAGAAGKIGRELTPDELDAELRAVARAEPEQLAPGGDYLMEVAVPNSPHKWRLRRDGVWCRFSNGEFCLIPAAVPPELLAIPVEGGRVSIARARQVLLALRDEFPILRELPLDPAVIQRILAKGPRVDAMKGQLLEELLAVRIRQALRTRAGRAALGLGQEEGYPIFIEGHRITDASGRQLTDGIIAVRRGGQLEVRLVLEAKSGARTAQGLALSVQTVREMSRPDRMELFRYLRDLYPNSLRDYIRTTYPEAFATYAARKLDELPDDLIIDVATHPRFRRGEAGRVLVTEQGGQVRRDVERLFEGEIRVDGRSMPVTAGPQRTRFIGAVPEGVDTRFIEETLDELGYSIDIMRFGISREEIVRLTTEIASRLVAVAQ